MEGRKGGKEKTRGKEGEYVQNTLHGLLKELIKLSLKLFNILDMDSLSSEKWHFPLLYRFFLYSVDELFNLM